MAFEILAFIAGVVIGAMIMVERQQRRQEQTFAEVDVEVRKQLEFYKNLSEGLKEDVEYLRKKLNALRNHV